VHIGYARDELGKELAGVTLFQVPVGKNMVKQLAACAPKTVSGRRRMSQRSEKDY
jgi:hypothetical protein